MEGNSKINSLIAGESADTDLFALQQWVERFPYMEILRLIYLIELKKRDKGLYLTELKKSSAYFSDRRFAYFFVQGAGAADGIGQVSGYEASAIASDYFAVEDRVSRESLKELAAKLKKARLDKLSKQSEPETDENKELRAKRLIAEKRYFEALKMLKKINLNNSEKNVYFALQIKYLETILDFKE